MPFYCFRSISLAVNILDPMRKQRNNINETPYNVYTRLHVFRVRIFVHLYSVFTILKVLVNYCLYCLQRALALYPLSFGRKL